MTIPDQVLIDTVRRIAHELGRPPKTKEVIEYQTIIRRWEGFSWKEFLINIVKLDSSPSRTPKYSDDELILLLKEVKTYLNRKGKTFSIENYIKLRTKLGGYLPFHHTIDRRIGWNNAKKLPLLEKDQFVFLHKLSATLPIQLSEKAIDNKSNTGRDGENEQDRS